MPFLRSMHTHTSSQRHTHIRTHHRVHYARGKNILHIVNHLCHTNVIQKENGRTQIWVIFTYWSYSSVEKTDRSDNKCIYVGTQNIDIPQTKGTRGGWGEFSWETVTDSQVYSSVPVSQDHWDGEKQKMQYQEDHSPGPHNRCSNLNGWNESAHICVTAPCSTRQSVPQPSSRMYQTHAP